VRKRQSRASDTADGGAQGWKKAEVRDTHESLSRILGSRQIVPDEPWPRTRICSNSNTARVRTSSNSVLILGLAAEGLRIAYRALGVTVPLGKGGRSSLIFSGAPDRPS
jgi:hypothetical protein